MKIGLQTWGSDGDILPFIALAIGLKQSGHEVTVAYTSADNKDYSRFAASHGISLIKAYEKFESDLTGIVARAIGSRDPLKQFSLIMESHFNPAVDEMYQAAKTLCAGNDIVIGHSIHYPLAIAAEKAGRPRISVVLCPMAIETACVSPLEVNLGKWLNSLLWKLVDRIVRKKTFAAADALRKREGLRPCSSLQKELYVTGKLALIATTSVLCPRQPDWGGNIQICGFLNPPQPPATWQMPPKLGAFLEAGEPPVYFTFGSFTPFNTPESIRLFMEAAKKAGVRAIIQSNWDAFPSAEETPDIYKVQSMPHEKVFPHCAMTVHHGGSGTTQSSLKAGKPSLVVAHAFDQGYWGKKLQELGVAGKVLHRRTLNSDALAKGIQHVLNSPQLSLNAQKAGKTMENEDGVANAVALIGDILK